ncbi:MAG: Ig-like domain-containing protein [Gemmatimonadales bacterium]
MQSTARQVLTSALCLTLLGCSGSDGTGPATPEGPQILALGPNQTYPGTPGMTLAVHGSRFSPNSVVEWNGSPRATTFGDGAHLSAFIPAGDLTSPDTAFVRVRDGEDLSAAARFVISPTADWLSIGDRFPLPDAEANIGDLLTATFTDALDPVSLTDSSVTLSDGGVPVPSTRVYDAATRTVTVSATLQPLHSYVLTFGTDIRSEHLGALPAPISWGFTLPRARVVTLSASGVRPAIAVTTDGKPHVAFRNDDGPGGYTLQLDDCTADCTSEGGWTGRALDVGGDYANLVAGSGNTLHIGYQGFGVDYANTLGGHTVVDTTGWLGWTSIGIAPGGRLHMAYYASTKLRHATCQGSCLTPGSWIVDTVDTTGDTGAYTTTTVDAAGTVHIAYLRNDTGDLRYATCPAECTAGGWSTATVASDGNVGYGASIKVSGGTAHLTYIDATLGAVRYATCSSNCLDSASWSLTTVAGVSAGQLGSIPYDTYLETSLALLPGGGLAVAYFDVVDLAVRVASCATGCDQTSNWQSVLVSRRGPAWPPAYALGLAVAPNGRTSVVWQGAHETIFYIEY